MEWGSAEGRVLTLIALLSASITSRKKGENSYLDRGDTFHTGILFPAFKGKEGRAPG